MITDAAELAIKVWVDAGSGVMAIWKGGGGPTPEGCYIAMAMRGDVETSPGWKIVRDAASPAPGAELEILKVTPMSATLVLECYTNGLTWKAARPDRKLSAVLRGSDADEVRAALAAAGVAITSRGAVAPFYFDRSSLFEGRALLEIGISYNDETVVGTTTWIERVELEQASPDEDEPVEFTVSRPPDP